MKNVLDLLTYAELVAFYPPRYIRSAEDYDKVSSIIDSLVLRKLNKDQEDYLETLTQLSERYDDEHCPAWLR